MDIATFASLVSSKYPGHQEELDSPWVNILSHAVTLRILAAQRLSQEREGELRRIQYQRLYLEKLFQ